MKLCHLQKNGSRDYVKLNKPDSDKYHIFSHMWNLDLVCFIDRQILMYYIYILYRYIYHECNCLTGDEPVGRKREGG
jgi:hypothetical protein